MKSANPKKPILFRSENSGRSRVRIDAPPKDVARAIAKAAKARTRVALIKDLPPR